MLAEKIRANLKNIKYIPKLSTAIIFIILLIVFLLAFAGRTEERLKYNWLTDNFPGFYQHVSNLSISYLIYSTVGYVWILMGVPLKSIVGLGCIILSANFVYEFWVPLLNTRDITDAWYGTTGTVIGFIFLLLTKKFGVKKNNGEIGEKNKE